MVRLISAEDEWHIVDPVAQVKDDEERGVNDASLLVKCIVESIRENKVIF